MVKRKNKEKEQPFQLDEKEQAPEPSRPFGETPEEVREAARDVDEQPPEKKRRKRRKKKEVEEPQELPSEQLEQIVCLPLDFVFRRFELPELNPMERKLLSEASVPMWSKYGGALTQWMPEIVFGIAVIGIFEPRVSEMNRRRREAEKAPPGWHPPEPSTHASEDRRVWEE